MVSLRQFALWFARGAARSFYSLHVSGEAVPEGPLVIVANHPNMGADAAVLMTAACRPVRFLAKSGLFATPVVGSLLRAIGTIPVYRRQDDPHEVSRNEESFAAVVAALESGDAIGVFPEGISHDEPMMAPLRTGTARICLMAAERGGFPAIVPMGLTYRAKGTFRSSAFALVASPVDWSDLHNRDASDHDAVQELTDRIDAALRRVTVNVDRQHDRFVVELAERVHAAELDRTRSPQLKIAREVTVATALSRLRQEGQPAVDDLHERLEAFGRLLERFHLSPRGLDVQTRRSVAIRWTVRSAVPIAVILPVYLAGRLLLLPPYALTHVLTLRVAAVSKATAKILTGLGVYVLYGIALTAAAWIRFGPAAGWVAFIAYVLTAFLTIGLGRVISRTSRDVRRFLLLRSNRSFHRQLLDERAELANEIEAMRRRLTRENQAGPKARRS